MTSSIGEPDPSTPVTHCDSLEADPEISGVYNILVVFNIQRGLILRSSKSCSCLRVADQYLLMEYECNANQTGFLNPSLQNFVGFISCSFSSTNLRKNHTSQSLFFQCLNHQLRTIQCRNSALYKYCQRIRRSPGDAVFRKFTMTSVNLQGRLDLNSSTLLLKILISWVSVQLSICEACTSFLKQLQSSRARGLIRSLVLFWITLIDSVCSPQKWAVYATFPFLTLDYSVSSESLVSTEGDLSRVLQSEVGRIEQRGKMAGFQKQQARGQGHQRD